jgi:outer membrane biosynthesis protein TonB
MNNSALFKTRSCQRAVTLLCAAALLLLALAAGVAAQSTDAEFPTPIGSNEISGVITPRDVGDPRLTRYFYAFAGTPGDLVVTVESRNLNGDVDVFVAGSLRPLGKVSMYAGELSTSTSKTIYLRQRESLVLRVEARTPNDAEGSFRIRFGGSFEPLAVTETKTPETETPTVTGRTDKNLRRVTSVGGRIDEPPATETATAEPAPEPTAPPAPTEKTEPETATPTTPEPASPTPPRTTTRTRRPRARRGRAARKPAPPTARDSAPSTTTPAQPAAPAAQPEAGARLIIETKDGMRIERYMTTVRRVTVENGQIVVVTKDGKVQRQPMTNVVRMAIEQ